MVSSPFFYLYFYTNKCCSHHNRHHLIKLADSVIVSILSNDNFEHGPVLNDFLYWCKSSFYKKSLCWLKTKQNKTKERHTCPAETSGCRNVAAVSIPYCNTVINSTLCFEPQVNTVCKKARQHLHFWPKLCSFNKAILADPRQGILLSDFNMLPSGCTYVQQKRGRASCYHHLVNNSLQQLHVQYLIVIVEVKHLSLHSVFI